MRGLTFAASCLFVLAAGLVAYTAMYVPVDVPVFRRSEAVQHWHGAMWAAAFVLAVDAPVVAATMRSRGSPALFALFAVVVGFQIGHFSEHAAQVTQLLMSGGDLVHSHGLLGRWLDFETVHFFSDIGVWIAMCVLLWAFPANGWLRVAFAAASFHAVEHVYLYWIALDHPAFYEAGGLAGIMGHGGVIGSPLYRPYLHFTYNLLVLMPLLIALIRETQGRGAPLPKSTRRKGKQERTDDGASVSRGVAP